MFEIRQIKNKELQNTSYHEEYASLAPYMVTSNGKVVAYLWFRFQGESLYLYMIEVIKKRKGIGEKVIEFLFNHYGIDEISGFILSELRAYNFWEKVGASIYYIDVEGYQDGEELVDAGIESPFTLSKENFEMNQTKKHE